MQHLISVAPMMERTDRHFRYFLRQITARSLLYTEMITTAALHYGDRQRLLDFSIEEKPLALQLGGDDPHLLAQCAIMAQDWGYDEVNLNIGCPSPRVQSGNFGACLMLQPHLVASAVEAIKAVVDIPVTVKHRIGVDELDSYEDLANFVAIVSQAGASRFTCHARKAWLKGLSPKENRTVPPLRYQDVYQLKQDFSHLEIEINGGITNLEQAQEHLQKVDAVMIGRGAYDNPYLLSQVDRIIYKVEESIPSRYQIVERMLPYVDDWVTKGGKLHSITRHLLELFAGRPGTKAWKRYITEQIQHGATGVEVIETALAKVAQYQ
ncbi:MAG: tRNA dihydrouridine(20/20a) synthase DusA [Cyanobacteriota bacterium ELA615]|jgi:tRNA-dihydrouridine synthase A